MTIEEYINYIKENPYIEADSEAHKVMHKAAEEYINYIKENPYIEADSEAHKVMHKAALEARKITSEINNSFHDAEELRDLFSKLIGKKVDDSFGLFPPFYTDFGKNITIGKRVFINEGCSLSYNQSRFRSL